MPILTRGDYISKDSIGKHRCAPPGSKAGKEMWVSVKRITDYPMTYESKYGFGTIFKCAYCGKAYERIPKKFMFTPGAEWKLMRGEVTEDSIVSKHLRYDTTRYNSYEEQQKDKEWRKECSLAWTSNVFM